MSFDLNSCSQDCFNCIKSYKKKHRLTGVEENPFKISCSGIPQNYVSEDLYQILPEEQVETAKIMLDPVAWAREVLDWHCLDPDGEVWKRKNPEEYYDWIKKHPDENILGHSRYHRPYQAFMLKCSSKRKVFRIGRQCLERGTLIATPMGPKPIESFNVGDEVYGWKDDGSKYGTIEIAKVKNIFNNGVQEVSKLYHGGQYYLSSTQEHRWLTTSSSYNKKVDSRPLKSFSRDEVIIRKFFLPKLGDYCEKNAYVIGALLGDGCSREDTSFSVYVSSSDFYVPSKIASILGLGYSKNHYKNFTWRISKDDYKTKIDISLYYEQWIKGRYAHEKIVDIDVVKTWDLESCLKFMAGFLDTDGSVRLHNNILSIHWGCQSKSAIEVIQYLLLTIFQFRTSIYVDNRDKYVNGPVYTVGSNNNLFSKRILRILDKYIVKPSRKWHEDKYSHLLEQNSNPDFFGLKQKEKYFSEVFDLEIDNDSHLYLTAEGLVTHNSGKTECLVISILFNLFTKPGVPENEGFRVVVITPFQSQIDLIFNRMDELLRNAITTQNAIASRTKSAPCKLILHNGSIVTGFTAGTKSGGNADAVRGQKANMLVLDEADRLSAGDLESSLSLITNFPNATLWMSSTPVGTRNKFYSACQSKIYKEFHFPSYVNPLYGPELEVMYREMFTESAYKHEVEAEFGEQEEGVFQNTYVEAAQAEYQYGQIARSSNWIYMLGVDWNDVKIGTSIAVVGFNIAEQIFYLLAKERVSRDGWTQTAACQKIAQLNQFWHPKAIYVDSGGPAGGGTQVEMLKLFAWQSIRDNDKGAGHPDSRLKDIVKPYSFGGSIEIHDLITKQPIKKPAKPFLVENTVRKFEHGVFKYPKSDENFTKQLLGYVIDRVNQSGTPVYKAMDETVGDHDLDAVMLALVAFTLETTDFGKPKFSIDFAFSGKIGEKVEAQDLPGWVKVKSDRKVDEGAKHRPDLKRAEGFENEKKPIFSTSQGLPAKNTTRDTGGVKLWTWPGFSRDEPRPTSSVRSVRNGMSVRVLKPKRKNI